MTQAWRSLLRPRDACCNARHFQGANLSAQNNRGVERGKRGATAEATPIMIITVVKQSPASDGLPVEQKRLRA